MQGLVPSYPHGAPTFALGVAIHEPWVLQTQHDRAFVARQVAVEFGQGEGLIEGDAGKHFQGVRAQRPVFFL